MTLRRPPPPCHARAPPPPARHFSRKPLLANEPLEPLAEGRLVLLRLLAGLPVGLVGLAERAREEVAAEVQRREAVRRVLGLDAGEARLGAAVAVVDVEQEDAGVRRRQEGPVDGRERELLRRLAGELRVACTARAEAPGRARVGGGATGGWGRGCRPREGQRAGVPRRPLATAGKPPPAAAAASPSNSKASPAPSSLASKLGNFMAGMLQPPLA